MLFVKHIEQQLTDVTCKTHRTTIKMLLVKHLEQQLTDVTCKTLRTTINRCTCAVCKWSFHFLVF